MISWVKNNPHALNTLYDRKILHGGNLTQKLG
jgi:hypothetical protein